MSGARAKPAIGRHFGTVVRNDVRRDSNGFEDIDDFWDDDTSSAANDSTTDIERSRDAFEFSSRATKSSGTKPVLRTPKKGADLTPKVNRNSDGFEDIHDFWAEARASANELSPTAGHTNDSVELGGTDLDASGITLQPAKAVPPLSAKKHKHLNRRQRRHTLDGAPQPTNEGINDKEQQAITPPFARRPKFPSSSITASVIIPTSTTQPMESIPTKHEPSPQTPLRQREDSDVYSFSNMSSPASTVKSTDSNSPQTSFMVSPTLTPLRREHRNVLSTPSPTPTEIRAMTPLSPGRANDVDHSMVASEQDESRLDDAQNDAMPRLPSESQLEHRESVASINSPAGSPASTTNRESVSQTNDLDASRYLEQNDVEDDEAVMPKLPTRKLVPKLSTPEKLTVRKNRRTSSDEEADIPAKTPLKNNRKRPVEQEDFEFGMPSPQEDGDPFLGNLTPISPFEDHTLHTPPSTKTKQRPPMKKKSQAVSAKTQKTVNVAKVKKRNKSAEVESDFESSFALTDQSRMDSESEAENDITVLSNADAIRYDSDNDESGVRRSKRRRIKPLAWYKCERPVYERRQSGVGLILPTISHIERAGTNTPAKRQPHKSSHKSKTTPFPIDDLPSEYSYLATDTGNIWDELNSDTKKTRVIGRSKASEVFALPGIEGLPCGYAGQTFNLPGGPTLPTWISGRLLLPPNGAKQPESVGNCTQTFVVLQCQPGSLEVAYADPSEGSFDHETAQRFLLSPGDEYFVPPQNAYYLRNHSKTVEAEVRFVIMKPSRLQLATAEKATTSSKKKTK
ncbi:hypothetical protein, variant [Aphanomyces invadans]|uniref:Mif2/CENP-C cupin domain-containing protein n=1 Tax=Aphanomyces invadans TaxID=157072 RepID=A0A024UM37_9STRA|nr:hypothetical protein, variant [Aphanomyces invadans]ETW06693.1 hypothetical protein, variant [Aphanomyces invadans]|eukprot:XP_008864768.1 hypothetical protein, variant [Aphanomyces invadans]